MELALEIPEIAGNLKMDELSRAEILKFALAAASASCSCFWRMRSRPTPRMHRASRARSISGMRRRSRPIKDVLAETEEEEEEEEGWLEKFFRELRGEKKPKKEPKSKYLDYLTKVAKAGPKGDLSGGDALKKETELQMELRRLQPKQAVLRGTTSTRVALRHWYFVFYVLGETEEALQDAGYM